MENGETEGWLDFAKSCNCLSQDKQKTLDALNEEAAKRLAYMISRPEKFL